MPGALVLMRRVADRLALLLVAAMLALGGCALPQATAELAPSAGRAGGALIVSDGDLWRYDVAAGRLEPLTEDDALKWTNLSPSDRHDELRWQVPSVSPDGAWLAYSPHSGYCTTGEVTTPTACEPPYMVLQPLSGNAASQRVEGTRDAVWAPDSRHLAYAPPQGGRWWEESDPTIWVYDLSTGAAMAVLAAEAGVTGVWEMIWSPDSTALAYIARLGECQSIEECRFEVQRLDAASGAAERVTEVEVGIASRPAVCWTDAGEVIVGGAPGARCSKDSFCVARRCLSLDGSRVAWLEPSEGEGATRLWVEGADGATLWERELAGVVAERVAWSNDGSVLLLDGGLDAPIWRVSADGTGEVEVVMEEGQLLSIVPQW